VVNPTHQLPENDAGARTLAAFRYQCAYGVILLAASCNKSNDYRAIWCEQEDDLLAEIDDHQFDSYQVKTRKPELGSWKTATPDFVKAIKLFVRLHNEFPSSFRWYHFVSNTELYDTTDKKKIDQCPGKLAAATLQVAALDKLSPPFQKGLSQLAKAVECTEEQLFQVLRKLKFSKSPSRDSVIAELAINHLPHIKECANASTPRLKRLAHQLISVLEEASALSSQDPARHYVQLANNGAHDPQLKAKRVSLEQFQAEIIKVVQKGFRYLPETSGTAFAATDRQFKRFKIKLKRGGLDMYADTLRNQALTTESVLLDLVTRGPEGHADVEHLRQMVKAKCDDAHLASHSVSDTFGSKMLLDLKDKLQHVIATAPTNACDQPEEVLLGIAGMLTENCDVWWSDKFDPDTEQ